MSDRNPPDLERLLAQTTRETVRKASLRIDARFTEEISSNKWRWSDGDLRDIVDTGRLRVSQTRNEQPDGSVIFSWPLEYATPVHDGGVRTNGTRIPERPWTRQPLAELPVIAEKLHQAELRRRSR